MISRGRKLTSVTRAFAVLALLAVVAVGVLGLAGGTFTGKDDGLQPSEGAGPAACATTVLDTLGDVAARIYREGIQSERTIVAQRQVRRSVTLREAIERGQPAAVRAAAAALVAAGHMTNLTIFDGARTLADVGSRAALTPLRGTITGAAGTPIASYLVSVWSDQGFVAETQGVAQSIPVVRAGSRTVLGSLALPSRVMPLEGSITRGGVDYRYTSFPARAYPSGAVRIYLFRPRSKISPLCGRTAQDTLVNTLRQIASLIYIGETGPRALHEIRRVQGDHEMLSAVAAKNPAATRSAIKAVLNQHIVRLRVIAAGRLLSDVGGPFVLGPRTAPLTLNGHAIGEFVLSIQDDSGYLKLTQRLAGLRVLMYMGPRLVMNSITPVPAHVPAEGLISDGGRSYRVFTLNLRSFPGGPLRVVVFVPIPYA
jgi:hypothetical protein